MIEIFFETLKMEWYYKNEKNYNFFSPKNPSYIIFEHIHANRAPMPPCPLLAPDGQWKWIKSGERLSSWQIYKFIRI